MRLALNLGLDLPKREALPTRDVGGYGGVAILSSIS